MRWIARSTFIEDGIKTSKDIETHQCTKEDFEEFYPLKEGDKDVFETLTSGGTTF